MGEARRKGQEGSRWINERPTGEELSKWFKENVEIDDALDHSHYVQGITLIPATEKPKEVTGYDQDGNPVIAQSEHLVYVPYAKVETRVKYFHDLMLAKADWEGFIEPVVMKDADKRLPPGFSYLPIATTEGMAVRFICCTMKVTVYKRGTVKYVVVRNQRTGETSRVREGEIIIDAPPATKMIPLLESGWHPTERGERILTADPSSLMKAETGAVGRALGMAGMLVIPGTGVATAEDMFEALSETPQTGTVPQTEAKEPSESDLPADEPPPPKDEIAALKQDATAAINALKNEHPDQFKLFQEWATERKITDLNSVTEASILRGLTAKAVKDAAEAVEAKAIDEEPEEEK